MIDQKLVRTKRSGVSMIETVVAIFVLAVIGGALMMMMVHVGTAANCAKLRNEAAKYAEEALEQARDYKQNNGWLNFEAKHVSCWSDGTLTTPSSCNSSSAEPITTSSTQGFRRFVQLLLTGGGIRVRSVVWWAQKCSPKDVEADTYFYQY